MTAGGYAQRVAGGGVKERGDDLKGCIDEGNKNKTERQKVDI
jgi:hypothetical protein